jgi:hypothetical protein
MVNEKLLRTLGVATLAVALGYAINRAGLPGNLMSTGVLAAMVQPLVLDIDTLPDGVRYVADLCTIARFVWAAASALRSRMRPKAN